MEQVIGISSLLGWTLLFLCEFLDLARGAHLKWRGSRAFIAGSGLVLFLLPAEGGIQSAPTLLASSLSPSAVAKSLKHFLWAFLCWTKYFSSIDIVIF